MSAMTAAELGFPDPPADQPQWLALAQAVYNTQLPRFDNVCGGGLRWQAYQSNGYNYKNSIANGCFFNIASRLAAYTGNASYAANAESTWDWMRSVGFIDENYYVYDGANTQTNCTPIVRQQYSYNAGIFLLGAATMYKYVSSECFQLRVSVRSNGPQTNGSEIWKERVDGMLNATLSFFFPDGIAYEVSLISILDCGCLYSSSGAWAPFQEQTSTKGV